jgi:hypothetical protein
VDGTKNNIGNVSITAYLNVTHNNKKEQYTFYIIDLDKDHMLLGMPFLAATNPEIDWTQGKLQGKVIAATTDVTAGTGGTLDGLLATVCLRQTVTRSVVVH